MNDLNYKPNSHRYKAGLIENSVEKPKIEKVTNGAVKTKKKSEVSKFTDVFVSEDINNVKSYVVSDVVIPAIKKLVYDIVTDGIDMILYGETGNRNKRSSGGAKVSYSNFYDHNDNRHSRNNSRAGDRFNYDDLSFNSRGDAEAVRILMNESIERYGFVTVADMYDAAGLTAPYTANKYGWTNISSATVVKARDGYVIKLPRACPID